MKLILIRHGETIENKLGILQGHLDGCLSRKGKIQAKKIALFLKNKKIDAIYSSDLKRALDTTKEIIKYHPNAKLFLAKELREKDHGSFTGKKQDEVDWSNKPINMETKESMIKRIKNILDKTCKKYKDKTVVFVTHGGVKRRIIEIISKESNTKLEKTPDFQNASISIININERGNYKIKLLNSIQHLLE